MPLIVIRRGSNFWGITRNVRRAIFRAGTQKNGLAGIFGRISRRNQIARVDATFIFGRQEWGKAKKEAGKLTSDPGKRLLRPPGRPVILMHIETRTEFAMLAQNRLWSLLNFQSLTTKLPYDFSLSMMIKSSCSKKIPSQMLIMA